MEKSSNKRPYYLIVSVFVIIIAVVLIWWVYAEKQEVIENLDKSIAVLPFKYLSEDPNKEYLANGVVDAITGHLSNIEGLRVMPRTSVEQYRETTKTSNQIGKELDVSYLVEGSFLMVGEQVTLILQLITAKDNDNIFFKEYNRDYSNILKVQSELAQIIAKEIGLVLMPVEKQRMENIPTTNLTAYDFFLRAREEHTNFWMNKWTKDRDIELLDKAIFYYHTALDYDSTYAEALAGLGLAFFDKMPDYRIKDSPYYDSLIIYANKAISYNDQLGEAHLLLGTYQFHVNGNIEAAIKEINRALDYDPNNYRAFIQKGWILYRGESKYKEAIINYYEAIKRIRTKELPILFQYLARTYIECGFYDLSIHYLNEALKLTGDTAIYNRQRAENELFIGNYDKSIELQEELNDGKIVDYPTLYILARQYDKAYLSTMKLLESGNDIRKIDLHRVGLSLWHHGDHTKGKLYLDMHIEGSLQSINENTFYAVRKFVYYDIAASYSFLGEKEEALNYLEKFQDRYSYPLYMVNMLLRDDPMFDNIREDSRYQKIAQNIELKYEAEHVNVKLWLDEQGLL